MLILLLFSGAAVYMVAAFGTFVIGGANLLAVEILGFLAGLRWYYARRQSPLLATTIAIVGLAAMIAVADAGLPEAAVFGWMMALVAGRMLPLLND